MALLINKLFSKKKVYCKNQDVCERAFCFSQDQVRVILFRECDFRGRKLLFDSQSVQKLPVSANVTKNDGFAEISNGYGYQYLHPSADIGQLGEIIFGTVAMSFRGMSFKIHNFTSPAKLICSQVFQNPKPHTRSRTNVVPFKSNSSTHSLERSDKFDCSNTSSITSFNDQFSGHSTESDIKIFASSGSVPVDVPIGAALKLAPSLECDSGFCGELSYNSVSSEPANIWELRQEGIVQNFSCGSLYKRWLRSTSTSLNNNGCSDSSISGVQTNLSMEENVPRRHRSIKLGLAVVIHLTDGTELNLEKFLLEHSALLEAMMHRARMGVESAYLRPSNFLSIMFEILRETSQWLTDLITGPAIKTYFWHTLCVRSNSNVRTEQCAFAKTKSESNLIRSKSVMLISEKNSPLSSSSLRLDVKECVQTSKIAVPLELGFLKNSVFKYNCDRFKNVSFSAGNDSSLVAEKFVRELCELIETIDVKHTNFFISTLLTAVLTNHLGWVSTVLHPTKTDKETFSNLHTPCNPLWGQLTDLYGAVGTPAKIAHTIICGSNRTEITKILNTLTYFIRCSAIENNILSKYDVNLSSDKNQKILPNTQTLDTNIFIESKPNNLRILSEKFQETEVLAKYETPTLESIEMSVLKVECDSPKLKISRTKSCLENLSEKDIGKSDHPILDKITNLGINANILDKSTTDSSKTLVNIKEASEQVLKVFSHTDTPISDNNSSNKTNDVIFVLGDDEKLIGIKKSDSNLSNLSQTHIPSSSKERPKDLNISVHKPLFHCDSSDSSPNESSCSIQSPYSDTSPCSECEKNRRDEKILPGTSKMEAATTIVTHSPIVNLESYNDAEKTEIRRREDFNRSQSVPPSDKTQRKCTKNSCRIKYSGVKFNFKQYPQIVTNYMRSKNLELSQLQFSDKAIKLNKTFSSSMYDCSNFDYPSCDCEGPSEETLQTPSNASELEFTSELSESEVKKSMKKSKSFVKSQKLSDTFTSLKGQLIDENNAIFEHEFDTFQEKSIEIDDRMVCKEIPMPRIIIENSTFEPSVGYTHTLLRGIGDKYISDMVLQGTTQPAKSWENILRRDLTLESRKPLLDQPIQEAVAIIANTDTWQVQLISSHTFIVEKGSSGIQVGMSQLVANMLESLLQLWKLKTPPEYCLMHLESKLKEFCMHSKSLAQLLLSPELCNMDFLTSSLQLEVNDVPLLLAVASTHSPQVTQKYGLSFQ